MALHTFVWLYFFNLLPSISRCVSVPRRNLLELMDESVRFAAWMGLFTAAVLTVIAPDLLTLIFGPSYRPASTSFEILAWMLPIAMLSGHHRYILIAYNCQKRLLRCTAISAAAAVLFGFALVPVFGGPGAAWALLIANLINFLLVYAAVRQLVVEVPVYRQLLMPLATLAVSAVLYLALAPWNVWIALALGCAVYVAGLYWTDGRRFVSFLRTVVRKPAASAA
jgi:O-antigen/teichoic acid export membrane protein